MDRRGFLGSILILAAAPAYVRAESLMRGRGLVVPQPFSYPEWETVEIAPNTSLTSLNEIIEVTMRKHHAQLVANLTANNALMKRFIGMPNPFVDRDRLFRHNWD